VIDQPYQVWAADITYIPMVLSFLYLVVVMDRYTAMSLCPDLASIEHDGYLVLPRCIRSCCADGAAKIFNATKTSNSPNAAFTDRLEAAGMRSSMDRPRVLAGQCFRRAAVAQPMVSWRALALARSASRVTANLLAVSRRTTMFSGRAQCVAVNSIFRRAP